MDAALHMIVREPGMAPVFDLSLLETDLTTDEGLQTAVIVSLFTDRRANDDDALPGNDTDKRGWWADAWPEIDRDRIGSRLWLLWREKQTPATASRAREYAQEALEWLTEDGIASSVTVSAEWLRMGWLELVIVIQRPSGDAVEYRFSYVWKEAA